MIVNDSDSISEALRKAGYIYTNGTNHALFKRICKEKEIDYSHFSGIKKGDIKRTFENVFCENSTASQNTLRNWYIKGQYSPYQCAICGINEWNHKVLTLRLDHINGYNHDNRLENLRWVCPNCDSQLDTYCKGHQGLSAKKEITLCSKCGKIISPGSKMCIKCRAEENRKVERPSKQELKILIRNKPFTEIAKIYGVSDKAIVKWCITENLPHRKKDIKQYTDL